MKLDGAKVKIVSAIHGANQLKIESNSVLVNSGFPSQSYFWWGTHNDMLSLQKIDNGYTISTPSVKVAVI